ncbi:hypothetical protein AVEN_123119-1 [Araneus ventricosus]|uniref:Uncharacterized protein n=1 Tax=Araneus ventricosus TaxID=182803 RepID=A0A4Y2M8R1_ARAVE|nr:hypothetical protein AVEN_123119-1 [Araneus ventricosus]
MAMVTRHCQRHCILGTAQQGTRNNKKRIRELSRQRQEVLQRGQAERNRYSITMLYRQRRHTRPESRHIETDCTTREMRQASATGMRETGESEVEPK